MIIFSYYAPRLFAHNLPTTCSILSCPTWVSIGVVARLSWSEQGLDVHPFGPGVEQVRRVSMAQLIRY
jgi:hypothetical protein